jgi:2-oxoisovalerate dehydrogenase E1 component
MKIDKKQLVDAYQKMVLARKTDEKAIILYKQNKCHFQIGCAGHEAVQVATADAMKASYDYALPYYRDMGFCAAWGMTAKEFMLGILNKADDPSSGGRQMPMHYGHKKLNIISQSSPTGTQFLQAVGVGFALRQKKSDAVVYVSAGEGTTSQGDYHEALNWCAREKLPVIFVIQDNKFAISVRISEQIAGSSVSKISSGFEGLDVVRVDGLNYLESFSALEKAVKRARAGEGPTVIDAQVVRLQSHSISDNQGKYRTQEEIESDKQKDPIQILRSYLIEEKLSNEDELSQIENQISTEVNEAAVWAEAQPDPDPASYDKHILQGIYPDPNQEEQKATGESIFMVDALNHALDEEMKRDPNILVFGQDVAHGKGGVFSVTSGLTVKHGIHRCFNSPLAEASIAGSAVGIATLGLKPVAEIQFGDYIWTAMMQIANELSTLNYRSNGEFTCPAVIRVAVGGYIHGGLYHSQNIEATFAHFPGLIVIYPSNATDAKGLLKSAIRCPDPVLFLEHKGLYRQVYAKGNEGDADFLTPIGKAKVVKEGTDLTIITWGALVHKSLKASEKLEEAGHSVEIVDLRTICPLDKETILNSVKKTGKVLVACEDKLFMSFGAEISAIIASEAFQYLDAPILRIGAKNCHVPHAPILEDEVLPQIDDIEASLWQLINY